MTTQDMLATVDLGSNSFRLQICHNQNGHLQVIDSIKEMVRLAAGLDEQKNLDQDSQQRALDCLARFGERLRGFNPDQVRLLQPILFALPKISASLYRLPKPDWVFRLILLPDAKKPD